MTRTVGGCLFLVGIDFYDFIPAFAILSFSFN